MPIRLLRVYRLSLGRGSAARGPASFAKPMHAAHLASLFFIGKDAKFCM
jgi:hypothetical protein